MGWCNAEVGPAITMIAFIDRAISLYLFQWRAGDRVIQISGFNFVTSFVTTAPKIADFCLPSIWETA